MKFCILAFLIVFLTVSCRLYGSEELGSLEEARRKYSEIFIPRNVLAFTVEGKDGYVFNGVADDNFAGSKMQHGNALWRKAALNARLNLYKYLAKNDKNKNITLRGVKELYRVSNEKTHLIVFFVAKTDVEIKDAEIDEATSRRIVDSNVIDSNADLGSLTDEDEFARAVGTTVGINASDNVMALELIDIHEDKINAEVCPGNLQLLDVDMDSLLIANEFNSTTNKNAGVVSTNVTESPLHTGFNN